MSEMLNPYEVHDENDAKELEAHIAEAGGFQRWMLFAGAGIILIIFGITFHACVNSHAVHKPPKSTLDDGAVTDGKIDGLMNAAHRHPALAEPSPTPELTTKDIPVALPQATPAPMKPAGPISPEEQARRQRRMAAFTAPQMIASFNSKQALEIPGASKVETLPAKIGLHLNAPAPPFSVMASNIIPAVLVNEINSDNPAPVLATVSEDVFDTATGKYILIPQGTRILGMSSGADHSGQQRINISWNRLIFPNTSSMDLPSMPGLDETGAGGFSDQINNHVWQAFGKAALMSLISIGQNVGSSNLLGFQGGNQYTGAYNQDPNALYMQQASNNISSNMGSAANQMARRGQNLPPTITIRPGYRFDVMATVDLTFPGPYNERGNP